MSAMNDENKAPQLHATSHATARAKGSRRKGSKSSGSSGKDHKDTPPASRPRSVQVNVPHAAPSGGTRNEGINSEGSALNGTGIINSINSNGRNASITPPATIYRVSASHRKAPRVFGVLFKPGPMGVEFQAAGTGGGCVVHRIKKTAMESTSSSPSEGTNSKRLNSEFQRGVLSIDALRPGDRVVAVDDKHLSGQNFQDIIKELRCHQTRERTIVFERSLKKYDSHSSRQKVANGNNGHVKGINSQRVAVPSDELRAQNSFWTAGEDDQIANLTVSNDILSPVLPPTPATTVMPYEGERDSHSSYRGAGEGAQQEGNDFEGYLFGTGMTPFHKASLRKGCTNAGADFSASTPLRVKEHEDSMAFLPHTATTTYTITKDNMIDAETHVNSNHDDSDRNSIFCAGSYSVSPTDENASSSPITTYSTPNRTLDSNLVEENGECCPRGHDASSVDPSRSHQTTASVGESMRSERTSKALAKADAQMTPSGGQVYNLSDGLQIHLPGPVNAVPKTSCGATSYESAEAATKGRSRMLTLSHGQHDKMIRADDKESSVPDGKQNSESTAKTPSDHGEMATISSSIAVVAENARFDDSTILSLPSVNGDEIVDSMHVGKEGEDPGTFFSPQQVRRFSRQQSRRKRAKKRASSSKGETGKTQRRSRIEQSRILSRRPALFRGATQSKRAIRKQHKQQHEKTPVDSKVKASSGAITAHISQLADATPAILVRAMADGLHLVSSSNDLIGAKINLCANDEKNCMADYSANGDSIAAIAGDVKQMRSGTSTLFCDANVGAVESPFDIVAGLQGLPPALHARWCEILRHADASTVTTVASAILSAGEGCGSDVASVIETRDADVDDMLSKDREIVESVQRSNIIENDSDMNDEGYFFDGVPSIIKNAKTNDEGGETQWHKKQLLLDELTLAAQLLGAGQSRIAALEAEAGSLRSCLTTEVARSQELAGQLVLALQQQSRVEEAQQIELHKSNHGAEVTEKHVSVPSEITQRDSDYVGASGQQDTSITTEDAKLSQLDVFGDPRFAPAGSSPFDAELMRRKRTRCAKSIGSFADISRGLGETFDSESTEREPKSETNKVHEEDVAAREKASGNAEASEPEIAAISWAEINEIVEAKLISAKKHSVAALVHNTPDTVSETQTSCNTHEDIPLTSSPPNMPSDSAHSKVARTPETIPLSSPQKANEMLETSVRKMEEALSPPAANADAIVASTEEFYCEASDTSEGPQPQYCPSSTEPPKEAEITDNLAKIVTGEEATNCFLIAVEDTLASARQHTMALDVFTAARIDMGPLQVSIYESSEEEESGVDEDHAVPVEDDESTENGSTTKLKESIFPGFVGTAVLRKGYSLPSTIVDDSAKSGDAPNLMSEAVENAKSTKFSDAPADIATVEFPLHEVCQPFQKGHESENAISLCDGVNDESSIATETYSDAGDDASCPVDIFGNLRLAAAGSSPQDAELMRRKRRPRTLLSYTGENIFAKKDADANGHSEFADCGLQEDPYLLTQHYSLPQSMPSLADEGDDDLNRPEMADSNCATLKEGELPAPYYDQNHHATPLTVHRRGALRESSTGQSSGYHNTPSNSASSSSPSTMHLSVVSRSSGSANTSAPSIHHDAIIEASALAARAAASLREKDAVLEATTKSAAASEEALRQEVRLLRSELALSRENVVDAETARTEAEEKLRKCRADQARILAACEKEEARIAELEAELVGSEEARNNVENELAQEKARIAELEAELVGSEEARNNVENELAQLRRHVEMMNMAHEKQILAMREQQQTEIACLIENYKCDEKNQELEEELERLRTLTSQLRAGLLAERELTTSLERSGDAAELEISRLTDQVETLENALCVAQNENRMAVEEKREQQKQGQNCTDQIRVDGGKNKREEHQLTYQGNCSKDGLFSAVPSEGTVIQETSGQLQMGSLSNASDAYKVCFADDTNIIQGSSNTVTDENSVLSNSGNLDKREECDGKWYRDAAVVTVPSTPQPGLEDSRSPSVEAQREQSQQNNTNINDKEHTVNLEASSVLATPKTATILSMRSQLDGQAAALEKAESEHEALLAKFEEQREQELAYSEQIEGVARAQATELEQLREVVDQLEAELEIEKEMRDVYHERLSMACCEKESLKGVQALCSDFESQLAASAGEVQALSLELADATASNARLVVELESKETVARLRLMDVERSFEELLAARQTERSLALSGTSPVDKGIEGNAIACTSKGEEFEQCTHNKVKELEVALEESLAIAKRERAEAEAQQMQLCEQIQHAHNAELLNCQNVNQQAMATVAAMQMQVEATMAVASTKFMPGHDEEEVADAFEAGHEAGLEKGLERGLERGREETVADCAKEIERLRETAASEAATLNVKSKNMGQRKEAYKQRAAELTARVAEIGVALTAAQEELSAKEQELEHLKKTLSSEKEKNDAAQRVKEREFAEEITNARDEVQKQWLNVHGKTKVQLAEVKHDLESVRLEKCRLMEQLDAATTAAAAQAALSEGRAAASAKNREEKLQLKEAQEKIEALESDRVRYEADVTAAQEARQLLEAQLEDLTRALESLEERLTESDEEGVRLRREIDDIILQRDVATADAERYEADVTAAQEARQLLEAQLEDLTRALESSEERLTESDEEGIRLRREIDDIILQRDVATADADKHRNTAEKANEARRQSDEEVDTLRKKLSATESNIEQLQANLTEGRSLLEDARRGNAIVLREKAEREDAAARELAAAEAVTKREVTALKESLRKTELELEACRSDAAKSIAETARTSAARCEDARNEVDEAVAAATELALKISTFEAAAAAAGEENDCSKNLIASLTQDLSAQRTLTADLDSAIATLRLTVASKDEELGDLQTAFKEQDRLLAAQLEQQEAELRRLVGDRDALMQRAAVAEAEAERLATVEHGLRSVLTSKVDVLEQAQRLVDEQEQCEEKMEHTARASEIDSLGHGNAPHMSLYDDDTFRPLSREGAITLEELRAMVAAWYTATSYRGEEDSLEGRTKGSTIDDLSASLEPAFASLLESENIRNSLVTSFENRISIFKQEIEAATARVNALQASFAHEQTQTREARALLADNGMKEKEDCSGFSSEGLSSSTPQLLSSKMGCAIKAAEDASKQLADARRAAGLDDLVDENRKLAVLVSRIEREITDDASKLARNANEHSRLVKSAASKLLAFRRANMKSRTSNYEAEAAHLLRASRAHEVLATAENELTELRRAVCEVRETQPESAQHNLQCPERPSDSVVQQRVRQIESRSAALEHRQVSIGKQDLHSSTTNIQSSDDNASLEVGEALPPETARAKTYVAMLSAIESLRSDSKEITKNMIEPVSYSDMSSQTESSLLPDKENKALPIHTPETPSSDASFVNGHLEEGSPLSPESLVALSRNSNDILRASKQLRSRLSAASANAHRGAWLACIAMLRYRSVLIKAAAFRQWIFSAAAVSLEVEKLADACRPSPVPLFCDKVQARTDLDDCIWNSQQVSSPDDDALLARKRNRGSLNSDFRRQQRGEMLQAIREDQDRQNELHEVSGINVNMSQTTNTIKSSRAMVEEECNFLVEKETYATDCAEFLENLSSPQIMAPLVAYDPMRLMNSEPHEPQAPPTSAEKARKAAAAAAAAAEAAEAATTAAEMELLSGKSMASGGEMGSSDESQVTKTQSMTPESLGNVHMDAERGSTAISTTTPQKENTSPAQTRSNNDSVVRFSRDSSSTTLQVSALTARLRLMKVVQTGSIGTQNKDAYAGYQKHGKDHEDFWAFSSDEDD